MKTVAELKATLRDAIDEVRLEPISEDDREALVTYLRHEAELLLSGPTPSDAYADVGYLRRR